MVQSGSSPVAAKAIHVTFDGGRLTLDAGVFLLADIERRLGIAESLARCVEDPGSPERVHHPIVEMIRTAAALSERCESSRSPYDEPCTCDTANQMTRGSSFFDQDKEG